MAEPIRICMECFHGFYSVRAKKFCSKKCSNKYQLRRYRTRQKIDDIRYERCAKFHNNHEACHYPDCRFAT